MKSYFDENGKYTKSGLELEDKFLKEIKELFNEETKKGYSFREISLIIHHVASDLECLASLNS